MPDSSNWYAAPPSWFTRLVSACRAFWARTTEPKWKLVQTYNVETYQCGLRAGQRIALKKDLIIRYYDETPTGEVHRMGERYTVLHGSTDDPGIVWLRQADGDRCTWSDDPEIFEWFEVINSPDR